MDALPSKLVHVPCQSVGTLSIESHTHYGHHFDIRANTFLVSSEISCVSAEEMGFDLVKVTPEHEPGGTSTLLAARLIMAVIP